MTDFNLDIHSGRNPRSTIFLILFFVNEVNNFKTIYLGEKKQECSLVLLFLPFSGHRDLVLMYLKEGLMVDWLFSDLL